MPDNLHPAVNGNVLALAFGNEKAKWPQGNRALSHQTGKRQGAEIGRPVPDESQPSRMACQTVAWVPDDEADAIRHPGQDRIGYLLEGEIKRLGESFEGYFPAIG